MVEQAKPPEDVEAQPIFQEKKAFRSGVPEWLKQFPLTKFPQMPDPKFTLIPPDIIERLKPGHNATSDSYAAFDHLMGDIEVINTKLMPHFRKVDFEAKYHQNRYRLFQILFMVMAFFTTLVGGFLAIALDSAPEYVPVLGLIDTILALMTTYVATIGSRVDSHSLWLEKRQRAEHLRREAFRFVMDSPPYDTVNGYERRTLFSKRAAKLRIGEDVESREDS